MDLTDLTVAVLAVAGIVLALRVRHLEGRVDDLHTTIWGSVDRPLPPPSTPRPPAPPLPPISPRSWPDR